MRDYLLRFGSGNPTTYTGLAPTFTHFFNVSSGATISAPGITEILAGSGLYRFSAEASFLIGFICDGATSGLESSVRYLVGTLDPFDEIAPRIGFTSSSFGDTGIDPGTLFGYMKRVLELFEGNSIYNKASGLLQFYSRGASAMLRARTVADSASATIVS